MEDSAGLGYIGVGYDCIVCVCSGLLVFANVLTGFVVPKLGRRLMFLGLRYVFLALLRSVYVEDTHDHLDRTLHHSSSLSSQNTPRSHGRSNHPWYLRVDWRMYVY